MRPSSNLSAHVPQSTLALCRRHRPAVLTAVMVLLGSATGLTAAEFKVRWIGLLDDEGNRSQAQAINHEGVVVGWSGQETGSMMTWMRGFLWTPSTGRVALGSLHPEGNSAGQAINAGGTIVGWSNLAPPPEGELGLERAFTCTAGIMTALPVPPPGGGEWPSRALGLNAAGKIVGDVGSTSGTSAFLFDGSLIPLPGLGGTGSTAEDISDQDVIVGSAVDGLNRRRACRWIAQVPEDLGTFGGHESWAYCVNESGAVVGWAETMAGRRRAFLREPGGTGLIDLGVLLGTESEARGINVHGHVVGFSGGSAFLYRNGQLLDLNDLIPPEIGHLHVALDINDQGQIVGAGTYSGLQQAFVLTPITPLRMRAVASRRDHGAAGTFDVPLPLEGPHGVECRMGAGLTLVFTFNDGPSATDGTLDCSEVSTTAGTCTSVTVEGERLRVSLSEVAPNQCLSVSLAGLRSSSGGALTGSSSVILKVLPGDATNDGVVNIVDLNEVKGDLFQSVAAENFRSDVNADGAINIVDLNDTKANLFATTPCQ